MNRNWTTASPALQPLPQTTIDLQQKKKKKKAKTNIGFWQYMQLYVGYWCKHGCMYTQAFQVPASREHAQGDRQEINKQVGFNRIVPGALRTRTHTQAERIRQHANTAKGKPKLIAETLRKWSPGWYVFYRWRLNRIAIFIILRETERERKRPPSPLLSLSVVPGRVMRVARGRRCKLLFLCARVHLFVYFFHQAEESLHLAACYPACVSVRNIQICTVALRWCQKYKLIQSNFLPSK